MSADGSAGMEPQAETAKKAVENLGHGVLHTALLAVIHFFENLGIEIDDEIHSILAKLKAKV